MSSTALEDLPVGLYKPVHVPVTPAGQTFIPLAGELRLGGWSFVETSGAAVAQLELWDGGASGGESIAIISLAAGSSVDRAMPGLGLLVQSQLTISVIAGSVRGSVWLARA